MNFLFTLALRYLQGRRQRTLLTTLAVTIGVMLIFGLNGMIPALMGTLRQNLMVTANQADLEITSQARGVFGAQVVEGARTMQGVASARGVLARPLVLAGDLGLPVRAGKAIDGVIVTGLESTGLDGLLMTAGRNLLASDREAVVITERLAQATGLGPGDTLRLPTVTGVRAYQVVGVAAEAPALRAEPVYMPLAQVQALFNLPGQINSIDVILKPGANPEKTAQAVLARLGSGFKIGENDAGSELITAIDAGRFVFNLFGALALVMGGFIIFNTFRTIVVERRRDIGMLRAIGATRGMVLRLVLLESLLQGLAGTALGLLGGFALINGLLRLVAPMVRELMRMEISAPGFDLQSALVASGMGLGVTLLSGMFPALAASRLSPLEAMRPAAAEAGWKVMTGRLALAGLLATGAVAGLLSGRFWLGAAGLMLFVVALMVSAPVLVYPITRVFGRLLDVMFAREAGMAKGNLARQPVRSAVTVNAVMIGLAVLLGMASVGSSVQEGINGFLEHSFTSDYLLMPQSYVLGGGNIGAGPDFLEQIRHIPGVADATALRLSTARSGTADLQVVGIDPVAFERISGLDFGQGNPAQAYAALAGGRAMIINSILAGQAQYRVGQAVTLQTAEGPQTYQVAAVANDILNAKLATAYLSQANLARDFHETTDVLIMVNRTPDADEGAVSQRLNSAAQAYPAFALVDAQVWRSRLAGQIYQTMNIFYVLLLALAAPSLLALMNTLGINVLERAREFGMLRAVGATRRQVRRLILAESLLLSAAGSAFGILAGLWLGYVLVLTMQANGFHFPYYFPLGGLLMTLAFGMLLGVVAALLPARSAARMDVVEALRYE